MAKLEISDRGVENVYTKNFYKSGGSKTYIPKNFYMKTTYSPLLSEKFGGVGRPLPPTKSCAPETRCTAHKSLPSRKRQMKETYRPKSIPVIQIAKTCRS
ncbi:hypothetical protein Hanom_Chr10g00874991 [Helianthus anomalus]